MSAIANIFGYLLKWLYDFVGGNYGFAILLFTIVLRIILLPITIKQQKSLKKTTELQGKIQEIQFKYKNNQEQMNKEVMNLYKQEKVSPLSGCLSTILQLFIIISVLWLVSKPLTYMNHVNPDTIDTYKKEIEQEYGSVSNYYEIEIIQKKANEHEEVKINMDFLGLDLSKVPSQNLKDYTVYIIPALYVASSILFIRLTTKKKESDNKAEEMTAQMGKSMSYIMPIMAVSIAFVAPLGLALYWLASNILMIAEKKLIDKFIVNVDEKDSKPKLLEEKKD